MAVVDTERAIVGWQMTSEINNDCQTAFQIEIKENGTNKQVFKSKKRKSAQSQLFQLPSMAENSHGYQWRVKVWNKKNKPSEWSDWQLFYIAPKNIEATWVGAISKKDAKIPDGKWSNTSFKQQEFTEAWKDVDSLYSKSILIEKKFCLKQSAANISNAVIIASGLGHYILSVNDKKVSEAEFAPLWSDYGKTVYYNTYDITSNLKNISPSSDVSISALLGNGMYNVQKNGRYSKFQSSFGAPKLFFHLIVNYSDGTQQIAKTDGTELYTLSEISFNSIYGGESITLKGDKKEQKKVCIVENPSGKLTPQTAPPVKINEYYDVKKWNYADSTRTIVICDMGQNLSGFPKVTVSGGKEGQEIKLTVSEKLNKSGFCDQKQTGRPHFYSIRLDKDFKNNKQLKDYDNNGFTWHPHFSYYGFRYIQIEGAVMKGEPNPDNLPVVENIRSCFVHNSAEEYSSFSSDNKLFSDTHRLIERAERSNMQSVFTDCPHREKLGWLEQDHLCGPSLLYNYNLTTFAPKFIRDICDAQKPNGNVPTIAPQYVEFGSKWGDFDESVEWGSTLVIFPFQYYEHYGDSSLIVNNYEAMCRYADHLSSRTENGIIKFGLGDWYDYQENAAAGFSKNTPVDLVGTAHFIYDLQLIIRASEITGNIANKQKYSNLLEKEISAFNTAFFHADSCYYGNNSQCSNALPLFLGICPKEAEDKVYNNLIADVMEKGQPRLTTGDVGNRYLIQTLSKMGNDDIVYAMFNHRETPGYGFQLNEGMTTLSEQWNPKFGTSLNHFMMGHIDEWLFKSMAGISNAPGTCGLTDIIIQPFFAEDAKEVCAETENLYGKIAVKATPTSAVVEIPVGCKATVILGNKRFNIGSGRHYLEVKDKK